MTDEQARRDLLRWVTLFRDLGVETVGAARSGAIEPEASARSGSPALGMVAETKAAPPPGQGPQRLFASEDLSPDAERIAEVVRIENPEEALARLAREVIGDCRRCRLCEQRTQVVFGVGDPRARLMFVGEGPGADEDRLGEPFVGRAGQLLDRIIVAMGLARPQVYIGNIVKCRPPENRTPLPDEAATCKPFLAAQIAIIRPAVIVALGKVALENLVESTVEGITRVRGRWFDYRGIPVKATFHPAYLLRNPDAKRPVWEDMLDALARLGLAPPQRPGRGSA